MIIDNKMQIERSVLNTLLSYEGQYDIVSDILLLDDFLAAPHQIIYQAIIDLAEQNKLYDHFLVTELLSDRGELVDSQCSEHYFNDLSAVSTLTPNALLSYAQSIAATSLRRRLKNILNQGVHSLEDGENKTDDVNNDVMTAISNLEQVEGKKESYSMEDMLEGLVQRMQSANDGAATYIETGFPELDNYMQVNAGDLVIIAARPSMGKTLLAVNMQTHLAKFREGHSVFFSLEMTEARITDRFTAAESSVLISKVKNAKGFSEDEWARVMRFMSEKKNMRFRTIEKSNITLSQIRMHLNKIKRQHGKIGSIAIDYLQIMGGLDGQDYIRRIGDVTRTLKAMGKEFDCPVFLLSQLNRAVEQRPNKRPMLSDLRDSGTIEQDADIVLMIYRDDYYKEKNGEKDLDNIAEIIVAKNRNGETGTARLLFEGHMGRFSNHMPMMNDADEIPEYGKR